MFLCYKTQGTDHYQILPEVDFGWVKGKKTEARTFQIHRALDARRLQKQPPVKVFFFCKVQREKLRQCNKVSVKLCLGRVVGRSSKAGREMLAPDNMRDCFGDSET